MTKHTNSDAPVDQLFLLGASEENRFAVSATLAMVRPSVISNVNGRVGGGIYLISHMH
jgi:hypothetical protein